jgi:thioredoxin 1
MDGAAREERQMKPTVDVTEANFKEVVEKDGLVLVDWWAPWCGPCRSFGPTYEKVAGRHPDVTFAKVNTEDQQGLAGSFQIMSIPTLMILRDKILLFSQPGALPEAALEELVQKARELDMDKVRAEVAAQEKGEPEKKAEAGA